MVTKILSKRKILEEQPIQLPRNPIWEIVRVFGKDEMIALVVGTTGTAVVGFLTFNPFVLAVTGPVVEKVGFFIAHIKERSGLKLGFKSMMKDLLAHDPLYAILMVIGLKMYAMPAWILSISCFVVALGFVALGEVVITEIRYRIKISGYKNIGFRSESYLESRFYIRKADMEEILSGFAEKFDLQTRQKASYHDLYFETNLESFNGREPVVRLRQRTLESNQTLQIVYTKASEMSHDHPGQFNYFPSRKDKVWVPLDQSMPQKMENIADKKVRDLACSITAGPIREINFTREVVRNPNTIFVSVDRIDQGEESLMVIEIKSHLDAVSKKMFIEAMRHVMFKYEVIQTTYGKNALV